jgi:transcriptional regulator with XRE-family HTH domain
MPRPRGHRLSTDAWEDSLTHASLTLTQVAERSGINRATLSGLLGGYSRAALPMTRQLADALGVRPGTLFPTLNPRFAEQDRNSEAA